MGIFLHFCIESIFSFIKKEKKTLKALVLFIGRGQNVRYNFLILNYFVLSDHQYVNIFVNFSYISRLFFFIIIF